MSQCSKQSTLSVTQHQIAIDVASSAKTGFPVTIPLLADLKEKVNMCFTALLSPGINGERVTSFSKGYIASTLSVDCTETMIAIRINKLI